MMSARRAVVVEAIDKLKVSEADALLRYLENPVPSSLLLIVGTKLDGKRKYAKALKKSGPVLEFGTPNPISCLSGFKVRPALKISTLITRQPASLLSWLDTSQTCCAPR